MRRLAALILMFVVPLQFAWSATANLQGHFGEEVEAVGLHVHDHHAGHDASTVGEVSNGPMNDGHNDDGHHCGHCHHVLSLILPECGLKLGMVQPGTPVLHPPARFISHTPPLFDRPPLALA